MSNLSPYRGYHCADPGQVRKARDEHQFMSATPTSCRSSITGSGVSEYAYLSPDRRQYLHYQCDQTQQHQNHPLAPRQLPYQNHCNGNAQHSHGQYLNHKEIGLTDVNRDCSGNSAVMQPLEQKQLSHVNSSHWNSNGHWNGAPGEQSNVKVSCHQLSQSAHNSKITDQTSGVNQSHGANRCQESMAKTNEINKESHQEQPTISSLQPSPNTVLGHQTNGCINPSPNRVAAESRLQTGCSYPDQNNRRECYNSSGGGEKKHSTGVSNDEREKSVVRQDAIDYDHEVVKYRVNKDQHSSEVNLHPSDHYRRSSDQDQNKGDSRSDCREREASQPHPLNEEISRGGEANEDSERDCEVVDSGTQSSHKHVPSISQEKDVENLTASSEKAKEQRQAQHTTTAASKRTEAGTTARKANVKKLPGRRKVLFRKRSETFPPGGEGKQSTGQQSKQSVTNAGNKHRPQNKSESHIPVPNIGMTLPRKATRFSKPIVFNSTEAMKQSTADMENESESHIPVRHYKSVLTRKATKFPIARQSTEATKNSSNNDHDFSRQVPLPPIGSNGGDSVKKTTSLASKESKTNSNSQIKRPSTKESKHKTNAGIINIIIYYYTLIVSCIFLRMYINCTCTCNGI